MSKRSRDNFTQKTIDALRRRVSNCCSNPECYILTVEPQSSDPTKVIDTGVAAHICAASIGGPRYDEEMTPEERKDIKNAIWLCAHCSIKIDREPNTYPAPLLHHWKKEAEHRIKINSNSRLYTQNEADYKVHHTLLQGMGMSLPNRVQTSISEVAKAVKSYINKLDQRLDVEYSFINGSNHFEIDVKEDTNDPVIINFIPIDSSEYNEKFLNLIDHGQTLSCDIAKVTTNSLGLDSIFPQNLKDGILIIEPNNKRIAIVEIQDEDGETLMSFEDELILGRETFSFSSMKYNNLLNFKINKIPYSGHSVKNGFNLDLNFHLWDNKNLSKLHYFDQIFKFYKALSNCKKFKTIIYMEGLEIFSSNATIGKTSFSRLLPLLSYTYYCRLICNILHLDLPFKSDITFTADEYRDVFETAKAIKAVQINNKFSCTFTLVRDSLLSMNTFMGSCEIMIQQELIIELDNVFKEYIKKNVFVRHTFTNPNLSILNNSKSKKSYTYKVKADNKHHIGIYKRMTTLTPISPEKETIGI